jgi:glyoxylate reductase
VPADVVGDGVALVGGKLGQPREHVARISVLQTGAVKRRVGLVDVRLVVLVVVEAHRVRTDVRLERLVGIGQVGHGVGHRAHHDVRPAGGPPGRRGSDQSVALKRCVGQAGGANVPERRRRSAMKVVIARTLPAAGLDRLTEHFDVEVGGLPFDRDWLLQHAPGAHAIVADPTVAVDGELLDCAGDQLAVVANFAVGFDNIDTDAVRERGLRATNTPDVLTNATAELAVALMQAAGRRMVETDQILRRGGWVGWEPEQFLGRELSGATVGLVGFGRIGQRVAALLAGFDVSLVFAAPHSMDEAAARHSARRMALGELLAVADYVSLHVNLTPQTRHMINARTLAGCKPGAILVNTCRGGVVDTAALADALRDGPLAAAGLDVYEDEPAVPEDLVRLPNTVLVPHIGSATRTTRDAMATLCADNVIAVLSGEEPPAPVV